MAKNLLLNAEIWYPYSAYFIKDTLTGQYYSQFFNEPSNITNGTYYHTAIRGGQLSFTATTVDFENPVTTSVTSASTTMTVTCYPLSGSSTIEGYYLTEYATGSWGLVRKSNNQLQDLRDMNEFNTALFFFRAQIEEIGADPTLALFSVFPGVTFNSGNTVVFNPVNGWNFTEELYNGETFIGSRKVGDLELYKPFVREGLTTSMYDVPAPSLMEYLEDIYGLESGTLPEVYKVLYSTTKTGDNWITLMQPFVPKETKRVKVICNSEINNITNDQYKEGWFM